MCAHQMHWHTMCASDEIPASRSELHNVSWFHVGPMVATIHTKPWMVTLVVSSLFLTWCLQTGSGLPAVAAVSNSDTRATPSAQRRNHASREGSMREQLADVDKTISEARGALPPTCSSAAGLTTKILTDCHEIGAASKDHEDCCDYEIS